MSSILKTTYVFYQMWEQYSKTQSNLKLKSKFVFDKTILIK